MRRRSSRGTSLASRMCLRATSFARRHRRSRCSAGGRIHCGAIGPPAWPLQPVLSCGPRRHLHDTENILGIMQSSFFYRSRVSRIQVLDRVRRTRLDYRTIPASSAFSRHRTAIPGQGHTRPLHGLSRGCRLDIVMTSSVPEKVVEISVLRDSVVFSYLGPVYRAHEAPPLASVGESLKRKNEWINGSAKDSLSKVKQTCSIEENEERRQLGEEWEGNPRFETGITVGK